MKSLHENRAHKKVSKNTDFFREIIALKTLKQKGTEKIRHEYNPQ